jgi:hypothetical protein
MSGALNLKPDHGFFRWRLNGMRKLRKITGTAADETGPGKLPNS